MTESPSAFAGSTPSARACRRSSEATVCRLFFTRWWISWARTPRKRHAPVLERDCCLVRDRVEQLPVVVGERRVAVDDELADLAPAPPQRQALGVRSCATLGPGDPSVLEHERHARRAERAHRRPDDRLERLLEVERLRDRLRDPGERLELLDPSSRARVELRVLDRLPDLRRDRRQQPDLRLRERPGLAGADVERALEHLAGEDRDGEDRLVLVLGQVRERLEPRIEMRPRRDHDRRPLGRGGTRDPVSSAHPRRARRVLDPGPVRRAQDELVGPLVVEVDEARIGAERRGDLVRDRLEHLLQVERGVDDLRRSRQEREVACSLLHVSRGRSARRRRGSARRASARS